MNFINDSFRLYCEYSSTTKVSTKYGEKLPNLNKGYGELDGESLKHSISPKD